MPLPFPLPIIPQLTEVLQVGLPPTLLAAWNQPSPLLYPSQLSRLFFSKIWVAIGPGLDYHSREYKQDLLYPHASGVVVDIGAGHGHTMQYLDRNKVTRYVAIEPNVYMHQKIWEMAEWCGFSRDKGEVIVLGCGAEDVDMIKQAIGGDGQADTIVSILTICLIKKPKPTANRLVNEVLREGGEMLWCEHIKSPLANVSFWQRVISPIWGLTFDGCNMCLDTVEILLTSANWAETEIWDMPGEEKEENLTFHQRSNLVLRRTSTTSAIEIRETHSRGRMIPDIQGPTARRSFELC